MAGRKPAESPLETAAGAASPHVTAAFKLLSSEVRLSILLALWEAYDPYGANNAVSFSELHERVGVRDSANFTYHLNQLTDHYVEKTDDGYELRNAGLVIVQAIIAGRGLEKTAVPPTDIGITCSRCGEGRVEMSYRDEAVYLRCQECEGSMTAEEHPRGTIAKFWFDPAGLAGRSPRELLAANVIGTENRNRMMKQGVCPACSGTIDASLQVCAEHDPGPRDVCPNCGTRDSVRVRYVCTVCKNRNRRPVELTVVDHPAVVSFLYDRGVDVRWNIDDLKRVSRVMDLYWAMDHALVSTDPVRVRVTVPFAGDELRLVLDENRDVIDVSERTSGRT